MHCTTHRKVSNFFRDLHKIKAYKKKKSNSESEIVLLTHSYIRRITIYIKRLPEFREREGDLIPDGTESGRLRVGRSNVIRGELAGDGERSRVLGGFPDPVPVRRRHGDLLLLSSILHLRMGSTRFLVAKGKRRCPGLVIEEEKMRSFLREKERERATKINGAVNGWKWRGKKRNDTELSGRLWLVSGSFERQSSLFLFLFYSVLLGIGWDKF